MIVECPACKARYRASVLPEGHASVQVKCPKCQHRFLVGEIAEQAQPAEKQPTFLLVDDARFFRELMLDLLKERNAQLITADNAADALHQLHKQPVDLLVIDINLPDRSGLDVIREIRLDEKYCDLPILCISGVYRKDDDAKSAIRAGADDFISKSFKPHELNERIDKLLKQ